MVTNDTYFNLISAHIISLLTDDVSLYVPDAFLPELSIKDAQIEKFVEWQVFDCGHTIKIGSVREKEIICNKLVVLALDDNVNWYGSGTAIVISAERLNEIMAFQK